MIFPLIKRFQESLVQFEDLTIQLPHDVRVAVQQEAAEAREALGSSCRLQKP